MVIGIGVRVGRYDPLYSSTEHARQVRMRQYSSNSRSGKPWVTLAPNNQDENDMTAVEIQEVLSPSCMQDSFSRMLVISKDYGYTGAKRLTDGTYVGIKRMITTLAICVNIDSMGYERRYCYTNVTDCLDAYQKLEARSSIPQGWVAQKP